jgi:hypothetical protein
MRNLLVSCGLVAVICGCSEFRPDIKLAGPTGLGTALTYDYLHTNSDNYFLKRYQTPPAGEDQKTVRNRILFELMDLVDDDYSRFERALRSDKAYKDVIIKMVSLGLSGGATFAGQTTANILAGIDTGVKGASDAVDLKAWGNNAPEILINKMNADRAAVAAHIYQNMANSVAAYPLEAGIQDVIRYRNEGYVTPALASLAASTAVESQNSKTNAADQKLKIK